MASSDYGFDPSGESIEDLVARHFPQCPDCDRRLNPKGTQHNCASNPTYKRLISNDTRLHRDVRVEADTQDPQGLVVCVRGGPRQAAYHEPDPSTVHTEHPQTKCKANTSHDPSEFRAITRLDAQERGFFPCNTCWPRIGRRATRIYRELYGEDY